MPTSEWMTGTEPIGLPSGTGPEPGERDPPYAPVHAPKVKENPHFVFRLDHDRAHDGSVKATPLRGGLRPAWTPPPPTRLPIRRRKPAKTTAALHNQDLTGPAPSWMTSSNVTGRNVSAFHNSVFSARGAALSVSNCVTRASRSARRASNRSSDTPRARGPTHQDQPRSAAGIENRRNNPDSHPGRRCTPAEGPAVHSQGRQWLRPG